MSGCGLVPLFSHSGLERRISRRDLPYPTASFPRERSDQRGKVSQRGVCGANPSCDGWGKL